MSSGFNIQLNEKDVNEYVTKAILESTLGKNLTAAINKAFNEAMDGYNSPVKKTVENHIHSVIQRVLELPENEEIIKLAIGKHMSEEFLSELLSRSVDKAMKSMRDSH